MPVLGGQFSTERKLDTHVANVHEINERDCDLCEEKLKTKVQFDNHMKMKHKPKLINCKFCDKEFPCGSMSYHIKKCQQDSNNEEMVYKCDKCTFEAGNSSNVKKHQSSCGKESIKNKVDYSCDICEKTFVRMDSLNRLLSKKQLNVVYVETYSQGKTVLKSI